MTCARAVIAHTCVTGLLLFGRNVAAQERSPAGPDSVHVRFVDADLRTVVQALARYLPKPVMMGTIGGQRVTLESPGPVAQRDVLPLLRGLLESQQLRLTEDSSFFAVEAAPPPSPLPRRENSADGPPGLVTLHVIRLKHARAADVAATVNLLFGGGGGDFSGRTGLSGGTLSDDLRRSGIVPPGAAAAPPPTAPEPARPAMLSGQVVIVPDELTNALLVRASAQDFNVMKEAVDQLDVRPLQVLIEVLIVEARKDRNFSLGADISVPPQSLGGDGTVEGNTVGGGLGDLIIKFMKLGKGDVNAIIRMAQSRGDVRIVSRPVLLASNNVEARFLVGSQRPFVQISRTQPTDGATRDQVVQYKDVGTKLTVRPTINHDGYVSLVVQQEISTATDETQFDAPIISTREAVTQVLVRDGQTIVIGGLRDKLTSDSRSGVPILSSIPLLGGLFGSLNRSRVEVELFLFLTPRIIAEDEDVERIKQGLQATGETGR
jgi:general secretion pathway protein D